MLHYYLALLPSLLFVAFTALLFIKKVSDSRFWYTGSSERLLRPAGETIRRKIESIDAQIQQSLFRLGVAVLVQILVYLLLNATNIGLALVYLLAAASAMNVCFTFWYLAKTALLIRKRRSLPQSYLGERLVGEYLNLVTMDGYQIFHDLQFRDFNIDHAVVGPAGVFSFETKTCPRRKVNQANRILKFDGEQLQWPNGKSNDLGLKQCADHSEKLQQWLAEELGEAVEVQPVLVFPGWTVDSELDGPLKVLSPKRIRTFLKNQEQYGNVFPDSAIKLISSHLAEKSRLLD